jgi:hypothetical protein
MEPLQITSSRLVEASPQQVYPLIADFQDGHPRILPKPYFRWLKIEQGGYGAGTVIRFQMRALGTTQTFRAAVTEPEPGRVLVETDLATGAVTTFTVDPLDDAQRSRVTTTTAIPVHQGLFGLLERWITKTFLRRVYAQELALLAAAAGNSPAHA